MKKIERYCILILTMLLFAGGCKHQPIIVNTGQNNNNNNNNNNGNPNVKPDTGGTYVVFAWNDQGMHEMTASYNTMVLQPPNNTLIAQVVKRGNPPQVVSTGVSVEYRIINNTSSYGKQSYGGFWDNAVALFGQYFGISSLSRDIGLTGNGLSGKMKSEADHFIATGIPLTPVDDNNTWNPYQIAEIIVKDQNGTVMVKTQAVMPVSDEINCAKCHGSNAFNRILAQHDDESGTSISSQTPVLCASCHGSPSLNMTGQGSAGTYLSRAMHGFHSHTDNVKNSTCYDCHPGSATKLNRSTRHTSSDGNCAACHGDMNNVYATIVNGRVPWLNEPGCTGSSCHDASVAQVNTGSTLYKNSHGHGNLYCAACHGTQHAMYPSNNVADNYQATQYLQNVTKVKTIGSCGTCHPDSRGKPVATFANIHGNNPPSIPNACHICHTQVSANEALWPHSHQWKNSNL